MRSDILSNIATEIPDTITTNYPKNAGMATTASKASEDRKASGDATVTNTTEQPPAAFATVSQPECFECSTVMVSDY
ncbi:hypothetical protein DSM107010_52450 [Chroococcidiopsis cubana SAG 39.79]|uniref:Uncharacterized protein n=1 Tax=Chroococcidiopsis cubana SAG 39.79 TaxID=388085 RepID=A0AB37UCY4_9CYAN|nr:hypothetical protein DSM107010_52450 [Chroococcidiopsis cubana SAG 39.79]